MPCRGQVGAAKPSALLHPSEWDRADVTNVVRGQYSAAAGVQTMAVFDGLSVGVKGLGKCEGSIPAGSSREDTSDSTSADIATDTTVYWGPMSFTSLSYALIDLQAGDKL